MSTASNLYAEKVFAEHPIALWALDDKADFVNLLSLSQQDFASNWTVSGGTAFTTSTQSQGGPIADAPTSGFESSTESNQVVISSGDIASFTDLDPLKNSLSVSQYFKSSSALINNVRIILQYGGTQVSKTFNVDVDNQWVFMSETFELPASFANFQVLIEINFSQTIPGTAQQFFINGISVGQWSESYSFSSSGVIPEVISESINLPGIDKGIAALPYGLQENNGYYLSANNSLRSYNDGFPMVYGASSVTKVTPNAGLPSVIFPGYGFMNSLGQYKDYTAEMWIKINSRSTSPRRVFGPISSADGLYVDGSYLVLKIGDNVASHFAREWNRPMLIHIRVAEGSVSLLINGEQVISQVIDTNLLELPSGASETGMSNDWLGFYAYSDVPVVELDCFAIYSYQVPEVVAKRRWVYGQGVEFPEGINTAYNGDVSFIDYRFAQYSNNYLYPDIGRWEQGVYENLTNENNTLSGPRLELPDINLQDGSDPEQWISDSETAFENSSETVSFLDFSQKQGHLLFESIGVIDSTVKAIYGVFKTDSTEEQTLFKIEDKGNNDYLAVKAQESSVSYVFKYGQGSETVLASSPFTTGVFFNAGIDFDKFGAINSNVSTFLGNKNRLRVYVGGQSNQTKPFLGKLYRFGLSSARNLEKIKSLFTTSGIADQPENVFDIAAVTDGGSPTTTYQITTSGGSPSTTLFADSLDGGEPLSTKTLSFVSHIASYTLIPKYYLGSFRLDIGCDSYWQDYVPLKYFAKFVENQEGKQSYGLDFLQINLGYPKLEIRSQENYVTRNLAIKTFVSFQTISSGANNNDQYFSNTIAAPANGVVIPGDEWINTKYEVVDDTILYIPTGIDFNQIAIVFHIQFESDGIFTNNFKLKSLQIAGQALSYHNPTNIGTRYGTEITPFFLRGVYKDYKTNNPFSIYKGSTPYLYLTSNTGIRLRGDAESMDNRVLSIPINKNRASTYRLGALQLALRYQQEKFPGKAVKIFELNSLNEKIVFYMEPTNASRTRAKIYAVNAATQLPVVGLSYFLNGKRVKSVNILAEEWNMLGIQLLNSLNLDNFTGSFDLAGPVMINNVASYQLSATQQATSTIFRTWAQVPNLLDKEDDPATVGIDESVTFWGDLVSEEYLTSWGEVLFIPVVKSYFLDPSKIYNSYTGTNKSIVSNNKVLRFGDYSYRFYKDANWQSTIIRPV